MKNRHVERISKQINYIFNNLEVLESELIKELRDHFNDFENEYEILEYELKEAGERICELEDQLSNPT